ncbi:hypothetical protein [Nitrosopumilus sp. S4]
MPLDVCDQCSQKRELHFVTCVIPTVFGEMEYEGTICDGCKSSLDYVQYCHIELYEELMKKLSNRMKIVSNKLKRNLR